MSLVLLDVGADKILKAYFNNTRPVGGNNLTLRLFVNNVTPAQSGVTYIEAAGGGYATISLASGSWIVDSVSDPSLATYAQQTFIFTGALTTNPTVYGCYITDSDGEIIYAEYIGAFTPQGAGDNIKITLNFQLSSGTPV